MLLEFHNVTLDPLVVVAPPPPLGFDVVPRSGLTCVVGAEYKISARHSSVTSFSLIVPVLPEEFEGLHGVFVQQVVADDLGDHGVFPDEANTRWQLRQ